MQVNYTSLVPHSVASIHHDTPRARSLASWVSIDHELDVVRQLAQRIERLLGTDGPLDRLAQESFTWHLVLRYGRCFDSTAAGRSASLGIEHVRKLGDDDLLSTHTGLIHRRHNTFAHPGGDCVCQSTIHLIEEAGGPSLIVGYDEEGPGPINDPDQVRLIARLCDALQEIVAAKIDGARAAHTLELNGDFDMLVSSLRANTGRHANPSQQAMSALSKML